MKENIIITIGREYGSGGHEVAEKLSAKLGIPYYDKNIVKEVADANGYDLSSAEAEDEKPMNPFLEPYTPYGLESFNVKLFTLTEQFMEQKAKEGSCIFVGRCSDYIFRDYENAYHFYIYATIPDRIQRIMRVENIAEDFAALNIIKKIDKKRKNYYQFYTDRKWGQVAGKDMMLNSGTLGVDGCVDAILSLVETKI